MIVRSINDEYPRDSQGESPSLEVKTQADSGVGCSSSIQRYTLIIIQNFPFIHSTPDHPLHLRLYVQQYHDLDASPHVHWNQYHHHR